MEHSPYHEPSLAHFGVRERGKCPQIQFALSRGFANGGWYFWAIHPGRRSQTRFALGYYRSPLQGFKTALALLARGPLDDFYKRMVCWLETGVWTCYRKRRRAATFVPLPRAKPLAAAVQDASA